MKTIPRPEQFTVQNVCTTIAFCSDGIYFYWIWCPVAVSDKNAKGVPVYMESFKFQVHAMSYDKQYRSISENLFMSYANNKSTDQPAHQHSLISTCVVHCLDRVMSLNIMGVFKY